MRISELINGPKICAKSLSLSINLDHYPSGHGIICPGSPSHLLRIDIVSAIETAPSLNIFLIFVPRLDRNEILDGCSFGEEIATRMIVSPLIKVSNAIAVEPCVLEETFNQFLAKITNDFFARHVVCFLPCGGTSQISACPFLMARRGQFARHRQLAVARSCWSRGRVKRRRAELQGVELSRKSLSETRKDQPKYL